MGKKIKQQTKKCDVLVICALYEELLIFERDKKQKFY